MADPASSANFDQITIQNLKLKWVVDFDAKKIGGSAELTVLSKVNDVTQLVCWRGLSVEIHGKLLGS
jgi:hypothetical protein